MAPLRQRYPYGNEGYQIPDDLGNVASESLHSKVFSPNEMLHAPNICSLPLTYALSIMYIHSRDMSLFLYMWL